MSNAIARELTAQLIRKIPLSESLSEPYTRDGLAAQYDAETAILTADDSAHTLVVRFRLRDGYCRPLGAQRRPMTITLRHPASGNTVSGVVVAGDNVIDGSCKGAATTFSVYRILPNADGSLTVTFTFAAADANVEVHVSYLGRTSDTVVVGV